MKNKNEKIRSKGKQRESGQKIQSRMQTVTHFIVFNLKKNSISVYDVDDDVGIMYNNNVS